MKQLVVANHPAKSLQIDQIQDGPQPACYTDRHPRPRRLHIVIIALILILAGSFCGAVLTWLQDAGPWQILLGYVAGGWAGFLGGMPVLLAVQMIRCRLLRARQNGHSPASPRAPAARSAFSAKPKDFPANRPGTAISSRTSRHRARSGLRPGGD